MSKPTQIKISDILQYLTDGYTRLKIDKNYDSKIGSIQEKYSLNRSQILALFKHPKLKGRKTIAPKLPSFEIVDDTEEGEVIVEVVQEEDSTSQEDNNTEEVSTPDTQTSTDIDDTVEEEQPVLNSDNIEEEVAKVEVEATESSDKDNEWLSD